MDHPIRFQTRSGELICSQSSLGITMDFPATPADHEVTTDVFKQLLEAL